MTMIGRAARRRLGEAATYLRPWLSKNSPASRRFVIFAQGRSGTWLLHDLLNQHPGIHCEKEILMRPVVWPYRYVDARARRWNRSVYGFHMQIDQLMNAQKLDPARFMDRLYHEGWRIIYLRRRNIVRQSISTMIATQRQRWYETEANALAGKRYEIAVEELVGWLQRREEHQALEKQALGEIPHLALEYEQHLLHDQDREATAQAIFAFLDLPAMPVQARVQRLSGDDLSEVVANYEEVEAALRVTSYAHYLA